VKNIVSFLTKEDFDSVIANQKLVDGTEDVGGVDTPCSACVPFFTWWDFLTAAARAPAFCNGAIGGMYSQNSAIEMCKKELAGVAAVAIAQTNAFDDTMMQDDGVTVVPFFE